jgi:MtN3 and saliva related transmembrane protein
MSVAPETLSRLGTVAGAITVGSFVPQVVRAWRTRRTRDLSLSSSALLIAAGTLWVVYGAIGSDWPVVLTNSGMVALNLALAAAKVRYR